MLKERSRSERVDHRVEHQADPCERLHRAVVEEERKAPPLLLLGNDQLVREARPLGLAHGRLREQARVLDRTAGEVGQQRRAGQLLAVERPRARELEGAELLAPDPQRQDDRASGPLLLGPQQRRLRPEEALRLAPRLVQQLVGVVLLGDPAHRLDERLEEARLRRQLLLGDLVPPPLGDDQVEREPGRADDRHAQAGGREPARAERQAEHRDDRGTRDDPHQEGGSSR
jgi:hypothetical protein